MPNFISFCGIHNKENRFHFPLYLKSTKNHRIHARWAVARFFYNHIVSLRSALLSIWLWKQQLRAHLRLNFFIFLQALVLVEGQGDQGGEWVDLVEAEEVSNVIVKVESMNQSGAIAAERGSHGISMWLSHKVHKNYTLNIYMKVLYFKFFQYVAMIEKKISTYSYQALREKKSFGRRKNYILLCCCCWKTEKAKYELPLV